MVFSTSKICFGHILCGETNVPVGGTNVNYISHVGKRDKFLKVISIFFNWN